MKNKLLLALSVFPAASMMGSVTLNINISGLENSSGTVTNGMEFGIIVDTSAGANGFEAGSYTGFDITTNGQFLSTTSGVTDDWFVYGGSLGTGQTPPVTSNNVVLGDGWVGIQNINFVNLSQGNEFAVIWFPSGTASSSGDDYGFFTDTGGTTNMVIPSDGNSSSAPTSVSTKSVDFQVVPEPSTLAFFGLFGFIFLFVRRRPAV